MMAAAMTAPSGARNNVKRRLMATANTPATRVATS
jgi:hypothetical protein